MRYGFTTGSCAAAAAKAAAYMLLSGRNKTSITIETPKGITFTAKILDIRRSEHEVSCAVEKDGGDDPDITTGALIYAKVSFEGEDILTKQASPEVFIDGGIGVGRVTKPGLDQPVGNLNVEIMVPDGIQLAKQTFNPRLGIIGGISILGTSGIVEPMSNQAILDTIRVELKQRRAQGYDHVAVSPGNYGLDFMKKTYGYDLDKSVKCSNFVGATIDMAVELGFQKMLFTGHIGKLIKVAGGIMNTHSREGDCRMELLAAFAIQNGVETEQVCRILECVTTEEAVRILKECGKQKQVMDQAMERICYYLDKRANGKMKIDCIMYSNEFGELAKSEEVSEWFTLLVQEQEP